MTKPERIVAATIVAIGLIITVLTTTSVVHWSPSQVALVSAEAGAVGALVLALYFHFKPGTKKEPVYVGASFSAVVLATITLLNGFDVTHFSKDAVTAIVAAVGGLVVLISATFSRAVVNAPATPSIE